MAGIYDYLYGPGGILQPTVPVAAPLPAAPAPDPFTSPGGGAGVSNLYPTLGASLAGASYSNPAVTAGSVGGNVAAAPIAPQASSTSLDAASADGGVGGQAGAGGDSFLNALRGVKAPPAPVAQTVRTPPPPALAPIKGGELFSMLASLGVGPQELLKMKLGGR